MPVLRRKSKGFASLKKMEIETAHPPEQQNTGQRLHRMQGLALETRELSSATSNEASVQATHNTTPTASRIVSTVPGSGQPLSSLTGLSAGSLARRRLLRRMDRVAEILEPRSTTDNLQQELHAFRSTDSITRQGHGPSAKYGSAQIAAKSTRAAPDLPRGIDKYSPTALSTTRHSYSLSKVHPINRSPDWFASHEAYTSGFYTHAHDGQDTQSALRSFGNASVPVHNVHADQAANLHARYEDAIPNYGLPVDTAEYRSTPQGAHYANVELGNGTPGTSRYPNHMTSLSPGCGPGDHAGQPAQDAYCFDQNIPMSTLQWELVERRPLQYSVPEAISYASEAHLQMNNRDVGRIDAEPFPMSLPYAPFAEDSARFQRGRADLFSYGPYPSSPPRLQPLRGFWQRNYL